MTVAENTPVSYKLNFKTNSQDITSPNLYSPVKAYSANLSKLNNSLDVPIQNLIVNYLANSSTAIQINIRAQNTAVPITADINRTTVYGSGSPEAQSFDNTKISTPVTLDAIMYTQSQECHIMTIRQQNPTTQLWSLCEIRSFSSLNGARTSVWVRWIEYEVSYTAP